MSAVTSAAEAKSFGAGGVAGACANVDDDARTMRRALDDDPVTKSLSDLIRELAENLRNATIDRAEKHKLGQGPVEHGIQCVKASLDIEEVLTEYNVLRDVLQDQAEAE